MQLAHHKHPWGQLVFGTSGVMTVHTDGATWLAPATRAIWMPADIAHEIVMKGEVAMRTLYIAPERAAPLPSMPRVIEIAPLLRELILHILAIGMLDPARPDHDRLAGLLTDLLVQARAQDLMLPLPRDKRAQTLANHLQTRPGDRANLADLAQQAGASLRTLQRLFPKETGLTVEAWRQKARLIWAVAQLGAGASVTAAALDCGYESPSAFITAFRRQFGVTPSSYRQR
ncbi:MAG TPA: helix-turn-helix transcriptional regulator [Caulobacteraceae bacterium]|nr:helix-turn-helix transcriptional regulator [Caulobacteraceae bacterium]